MDRGSALADEIEVGVRWERGNRQQGQPEVYPMVRLRPRYVRVNPGCVGIE